jgi:predicted acylesterase/phospholipase RssA
MKPKSKHINLVLSSTGALYPVHAGAACALMDLGYTFKGFSSTSGGAIIATALASGISRDRLKRMVVDYNPWRIIFKNPSNPFNKGWGIYDNTPVEGIVDRLGGQMTFEQSPIPIHIVATQLLPIFREVVLSKDVSPELTLSQACRLSSTIPILFKVASYKGASLIDGTFADNLHVQPFRQDFENTIAITINIRSVAHPKTFWQYIKSCLSLVLSGQGSWTYVPDNLTLIPIDVYDYITPLKFNLSRRDRIRLFDTGYNAIIKQLKVD